MLLLCPTGCGRGVRPGHLMCAPCWREVPSHLQRDVYRTWRAYNRGYTSDQWDAYVVARDAAIGSIR